MLLTLTSGAGAGKTTLAAALAKTAPRAPVRVLHGDDYYFSTPGRGVWEPDEAGRHAWTWAIPARWTPNDSHRDVDAALAAAATSSSTACLPAT